MRLMNASHIIHNRQLVAIGTAVKSFAGHVLAASNRWQERRAVRPLMGMSDYQLKDIGVSRADVHREATKPIWR